MKNYFTLVLSLLLSSAPMMADDLTTLQFVDANGTVIEDGSALDFSTPEYNPLGDPVFDSKISVLNNSASKVAAGIVYTVQQISGGRFECCYPTNCQAATTTGTYKTIPAEVKANFATNTLTEWYPNASQYGTCKVKLQIVYYKYNSIKKEYTVKDYGASITLTFNYSDPAGVENVSADVATPSRKGQPIYNLAGQQVSDGYKGIVIVNGRKVLR